MTKTSGSVPVPRSGQIGIAVFLSVFLASTVGARQTAPAPPSGSAPNNSRTAAAPATPATPTVLLTYALRDTYKSSGSVVLADSTVSYERIPQSVLTEISAAKTGAASSAEATVDQRIEKGLDLLVKALPAGTIWGKLYLPAPAPGRTWKGDDVAAFAFAQARLFGTVGAPMPDGSIEIMGKRVTKEAAPAYVAGLGLKPVYLLTNTKRQLNITSWSAASEQQWGAMSRDERKQYGEQQAAQIMALSPEERAQVLDQIHQHDKFFDTVKGPLEKLIGHDL